MIDEHFLETRLNRRLRQEDRALERLEQREKAALFYVGHLQRGTAIVYYINIRNSRGMPTGKIKEFDREFQAVDYLIRNCYV